MSSILIKAVLFLVATILIFTGANHICCEELDGHKRIKIQPSDTMVMSGGCIDEYDIEVVEINDTQIEIKLGTHYIIVIKCIDEGGIEIAPVIDYSNWTELKPFLEDGTIGENWWYYSESNRRIIAETAIKNTMFYYISHGRSGECNCTGGNGDLRRLCCFQNAIMRYLKFGSDTPTGGDVCYYQDCNGNESCYIPNIKYNLPCAIATCATYGAGYGHFMCAIQVNENITNIDSWIFFQYRSFDIKPGSTQMPVYEYGRIFISISTITSMQSCNSFYSDGDIMRWQWDTET